MLVHIAYLGQVIASDVFDSMQNRIGNERNGRLGPMGARPGVKRISNGVLDGFEVVEEVDVGNIIFLEQFNIVFLQ